MTNSYAVVQSLRGYNNGGHMYGGGFLGYGNASSLTLSTCYMFVPEFQFFEKPGAGGQSYYGDSLDLSTGHRQTHHQFTAFRLGWASLRYGWLRRGPTLETSEAR